MSTKRNSYFDGREAVRSELWPDLPEGYERGTVAGTGFIHLSPPVCVMCGAVVGNTAKHDAFHDQLGVAAYQAEQASVMTNVIGPKPGDSMRWENQ